MVTRRADGRRAKPWLLVELVPLREPGWTFSHPRRPARFLLSAEPMRVHTPARQDELVPETSAGSEYAAKHDSATVGYVQRFRQRPTVLAETADN
jgi:hypothetical protein